MDVLRSHKRPLKKMMMDDGTEQMVDFGFVGDVDKANGEMLCKLIAEGVVPVMTPLTHDGAGNLLNTNADTIASKVACALAPYFDVTLTYCFEKKGVLRDADDDESVIPVITEKEFTEYQANGVISGGMIPKLENAFDAIHKGVQKVVITRSDNIDGQCGTTIKEF